MDATVEVLKQIVRPSSVVFLVLLLAGGVAIAFFKRTARAARWYFLGMLAFYWIGTAPVFVERVIEWQGRGYHALSTAAGARGARFVVLLGAGNYTIQARGRVLNALPLEASLRVLEAARVYALLDRPTVIVSGGITGRDVGSHPEGEALRTAMVNVGVPADHILVEAESKNTREEAIAIAAMLAARPRTPIVLVTSPTHMKRAVAVFTSAGFDVVPSASPYKSEHANEHLRWLPSNTGLALLDTVIYDTAATSYYRLRGWMSG